MNNKNSTLIIKKHEFIFCNQNSEKLNVFIDFQGMMLMSNKGKAMIPKKLIKTINFSSSRMSVKVIADEKWNENIIKNHPIRYRLGLIKLFKPYVKVIGNFELNDVKLITNHLIDSDYKVSKRQAKHILETG